MVTIIFAVFFISLFVFAVKKITKKSDVKTTTNANVSGSVNPGEEFPVEEIIKMEE